MTKLIIDRANGELIIAIKGDECNAWVGLNPQQAVALIQEVQKQIADGKIPIAHHNLSIFLYRILS